MYLLLLCLFFFSFMFNFLYFSVVFFFFFFQAEDGIRDLTVTGVQTCALPIFVDLENGGSVNGLIHTIATLITLIKPDAKIIPGHGPLSTIDDLRAYYRMLVETSGIVQDGMKAGKTLEELKKTGFPEKFKEAGSGFIKTDQWIETVFKSYSKK